MTATEPVCGAVMTDTTVSCILPAGHDGVSAGHAGRRHRGHAYGGTYTWQTPTLYLAVELRGDQLVVRRCRVCGAPAATNHGGVVADNAQGRLPKVCREQHGNYSIEQIVPLSVAVEG